MNADKQLANDHKVTPAINWIRAPAASDIWMHRRAETPSFNTMRGGETDRKEIPLKEKHRGSPSPTLRPTASCYRQPPLATMWLALHFALACYSTCKVNCSKEQSITGRRQNWFLQTNIWSNNWRLDFIHLLTWLETVAFLLKYPRPRGRILSLSSPVHKPHLESCNPH